MVLGEIACHLQEHPELGMRVVAWWTTAARRLLYAGAQRLWDRWPPSPRLRCACGRTASWWPIGARDRMPVADLLDLRFAGFPIEEAVTTYEAVCAAYGPRNCVRHS